MENETKRKLRNDPEKKGNKKRIALPMSSHDIKKRITKENRADVQ